MRERGSGPGVRRPGGERRRRRRRRWRPRSTRSRRSPALGSAACRACTPPSRSASSTSPSSGTPSPRSTCRAAGVPRTGALALLVALKGLERAFGRQPRERWGPREVDLDLLVFGRHRIDVERPPEGRSDDPAKASLPLDGPARRVPQPAVRPRPARRPRARARAARLGRVGRDGTRPAAGGGGAGRRPPDRALGRRARGLALAEPDG